LVEVVENRCRRALSRTGVYGFEASLNPYVGCQHGCVYCYSPFVIGRDPGSFRRRITVKLGISRALKRELQGRRGRILIGSVTDPYQPLEARYRLTRSVLELLVRENVPFTLMTKSTLFLRDLDLLVHGELGVSVSTLDDSRARRLEPGAPPPSARLEALRMASERGVRTYVFYGPVAPGEGDSGPLLDLLDGGHVQYVMVDRFRLKRGMLAWLMEALPAVGEDPREWVEEAREGRSYRRVLASLSGRGVPVFALGGKG